MPKMTPDTVPAKPAPTKPAPAGGKGKPPTPKGAPTKPSEAAPPKPRGKAAGPEVDNTPLDQATGRPILYPEYKSIVRVGENAVTVEEMKKLLGWETEHAFKERMKGLGKTELSEKGYGDEYTLTIDVEGRKEAVKVLCHNNSRNRPFRSEGARGISQDILNSGPLIPEDERAWQFNGEPIIIGRTGLILSGQHRGIGLILAWILLNHSVKGAHWREMSWPKGTEPTLETAITYGVRETKAVIRTFDNTLTRTTSDTVFTSGLFDDLPRGEKIIASKATDNCLRLLWKRIRWADNPSTHVMAKNHREEARFLDLHPKVSECVRFVMQINPRPARPLATLGLLAGESAALLYLMGSSASDGDVYSNAEPIPSEKVLDWSNWDKAREFFTKLTAEKDTDFQGLRDALLLDLKHPTTGAKASPFDIRATVCKAWQRWMEGEPLDREGVLPLFSPHATTGDPVMMDGPHVCGGIDRGDDKDDAPPPSPEELKAKKESDRRALVQESKRKAAEQKAAKVKAGGLPDLPPPLRGRKAIQAEQTRKAREADEALERERAGEEE